MNQLYVENKKLRDCSPEKSRFVELENEMSLAKEDITNLNAELTLQCQQLSKQDFVLWKMKVSQQPPKKWMRLSNN